MGSSCSRWDSAHTGVGGLGLGGAPAAAPPVIGRRGVHPGGGGISLDVGQQKLSKTSEDEPRALGAAVGDGL